MLLEPLLKHQVASVAIMHGERASQRLHRAFTYNAKPWRTWHGRQNARVRCPVQSAPWDLELLVGGIYEPIRKTMLCLVGRLQSQRHCVNVCWNCDDIGACLCQTILSHCMTTCVALWQPWLPS